jgi:aspartyl-tRNA(Asn)/glutamyl-tRNA(Gln) amidotransferase subunit C
MKLTISDVEHVAKLARLRLTNEEKEKSVDQLSAILEAMSVLSQVPSSSQLAVERESIITTPSMRSDESKPVLSRESVFKNAPKCIDDSFAIPRVIE